MSISPSWRLPCPWACTADQRPAPFQGLFLGRNPPDRASLHSPPSCWRWRAKSPRSQGLWVPYDHRKCLLISTLFPAVHAQCHRADGQARSPASASLGNSTCILPLSQRPLPPGNDRSPFAPLLCSLPPSHGNSKGLWRTSGPGSRQHVVGGWVGNALHATRWLGVSHCPADAGLQLLRVFKGCRITQTVALLEARCIGKPELIIPTRLKGSHWARVCENPHLLQVRGLLKAAESSLLPQTKGLGSTQMATLRVTCPSSQSQ